MRNQVKLAIQQEVGLEPSLVRVAFNCTLEEAVIQEQAVQLVDNWAVKEWVDIAFTIQVILTSLLDMDSAFVELEDKGLTSFQVAILQLEAVI